MLYLLDSNVLIDANRDYYPIDRVPEFWSWLEDLGTRGIVKVPFEILDEFRTGNDALGTWARDSQVEDVLLLDEEADTSLVQRATGEGYGRGLTDVQLERIGRDPFLLAYCLVNPADRCVVTTEFSKPTATGHNRRLPDVCGSFGVSCLHTYQLTRQLNFSTSWNRST
jgi:hypothetical protein